MTLPAHACESKPPSNAAGAMPETPLNRPARPLKALARWARVLLPDCREVACLQAAAFTRDLRPLERSGLRIHLFLCGWCRRFGRQISLLRSASQKAAPDGLPALPPALSAEARERIRRRLQPQAFR
jgi:hypothetical protein